VITIQCEQYGVTVHLFIGTGRSPDKITSMSLTFILNHKVNYQGLSSLFPFRSVSSSTFVIILSRSSFNHNFSVRPFWLRVVSSYHAYFHQKENIHPKAEATCNSLCYTENIWLVTFFRTFGKGRPPTQPLKLHGSGSYWTTNLYCFMRVLNTLKSTIILCGKCQRITRYSNLISITSRMLVRCNGNI
jgi:hypothetical protein